MKPKDIFNLKNIKNFAEGTLNYIKFKNENTSNSVFFKKLEDHVKEQAFYRAYLCQKCLSNGACIRCGCKTPEMFFSPKKVDSEGKWREMLNKEEWEQFKKDNNIELSTLTIYKPEEPTLTKDMLIEYLKQYDKSKNEHEKRLEGKEKPTKDK